LKLQKQVNYLAVLKHVEADKPSSVDYEEYTNQIKEFCLFTLNREIYLRCYLFLIPFKDIVEFNELEGDDGVLEIDITYIVRADCTIYHVQYRAGSIVTIEVPKCIIDEKEAQKLIQIFNTFNPS
jgi:hypothetical protein